MNRSCLPKIDDSPDWIAGCFGNRGEGLMLLAAAFFAFLIYLNTLESLFILDDANNILNNPHIHQAYPTYKEMMDAGFQSPQSYLF